jgi:hypothetical protein
LKRIHGLSQGHRHWMIGPPQVQILDRINEQSQGKPQPVLPSQGYIADLSNIESCVLKNSNDAVNGQNFPRWLVLGHKQELLFGLSEPEIGQAIRDFRRIVAGREKHSALTQKVQASVSIPPLNLFNRGK